MAIKQLLGAWAPSAAKQLGLEVPQNWSTIAKNMYIPYDQEEEIIIEFDGMAYDQFSREYPESAFQLQATLSRRVIDELHRTQAHLLAMYDLLKAV